MVFFEKLFFEPTIGFFGLFKTHFTLVYFSIWAFFKDFFPKKATFKAILTNFFYVGNIIMPPRNIFGNKIFISIETQEFLTSFFPFCVAYLSLV